MKPMNNPLIAYIGDGKGKTTAALGCILRFMGYYKKILVCQFIKKANISGEQRILVKMNIDFYVFGEGFIFPDFNEYTRKIHLNAARRGIEKIKILLECILGYFFLIVL